jgi:hypothetical protein
MNKNLSGTARRIFLEFKKYFKGSLFHIHDKKARDRELRKLAFGQGISKMKMTLEQRREAHKEYLKEQKKYLKTHRGYRMSEWFDPKSKE